jgi:hypothetical protein
MKSSSCGCFPIELHGLLVGLVSGWPIRANEFLRFLVDGAIHRY